MRAVRMYKPGDLRVEDVPKPVPGEGEVLLKVLACGVCGSDIPRVNKYGAHIAPLTIGHEFSAEIVELGNNVNGFQAGDRVTVPPLMPCYKCEWCRQGLYALCEDYDYFGSRRDGAMAEYLVCPKENLMKLPPNVDPVDAATIDPCANAMHAILLSKFKEGETICVYGAGAIGLYILQCAKAYGASKVISVDISDEKLAVSKQCGADIVINSMKESDPAKLVREITNGGANVVVDVTGAPIAQINCIESARKMGRIVLLGISHKGLDLPEKAVDDILRRQLQILGSWNSFSEPFPGAEWTESIRLMAEGKITAKPMISHKCELEQAPEIFKAIDRGGMFYNKIMFYPWGVK